MFSDRFDEAEHQGLLFVEDAVLKKKITFFFGSLTSNLLLNKGLVFSFYQIGPCSQLMYLFSYIYLA